MHEHSPVEVEPPEFVCNSDRLARAFFAARAAHAGQVRGGSEMPYLMHPIRVATLLERESCGEAAIAAALLHDVVEDSGLTLGDVVNSFGAEVGELVAALTEDPAIEDWEHRKLVLRARVAEAGRVAATIYAADKIANIRDWRAVYARVGEDAAEHFKAPTIDARVRVWHGDLRMLGRVASDCGLLGDLRTELAAFASERTRASRGALANR